MDKAEAKRVYYDTNAQLLDLRIKAEREGMNCEDRATMARLRRKMDEARAIAWPEEER